MLRRIVESNLNVLHRNNVRVAGTGPRTIVFAHGLGCDQAMWRYVAPAFADQFRIVLFDHVGAGGSDLTAYDPAKYCDLNGYASDLVELGAALQLEDAVFVGHSVGATIGILASIRAPHLFGRLILIGPSPRYLNTGEYDGGFTTNQVDELLEALDDNYIGWSTAMAPVIMANADRPELGVELTESFCRTDPAIARAFARLTFTSDNRADFAGVSTPTLVLQCTDDVIAPPQVGAYVHEHIRGSTLVRLRATGHCPNLSAPEETVAAIRAFL